LFGAITSTAFTFATLPIGPQPDMGFIMVLAVIAGLISTIGSFLFVLGIYGLSIQYNATILSVVALLEAAVLILNESAYIFFIPSSDFIAMMSFTLAIFVASTIISVIFGITLLRIRERAAQPEVFLTYGLVEVFWPLAYFMLALFSVGLLYPISQATSILLAVLGAVLFLSEYRRGPIIEDGSDWVQPSQVWE